MAKESRLAWMLRNFQDEVERGTAAQRLRGRLILRGFRSGLYASAERSSIEELAALLREEIFGAKPKRADHCADGHITEE